MWWMKPDTPDLECPECSGTRFAPVGQAVTLKLWKGKAVLVPSCTDLVCRACSCPVEFSPLGVKSLRRPKPPQTPQEEQTTQHEALDSDLAMKRAERRRRDRPARA